MRMAAFLLFLVLLFPVSPTSGATWCVCRSDANDAALQKTIDYACGTGADCNPILQNGVCFQPNTVRAHCSYAANSFFQRKGQAAGSCDFAGTATITTSDPSYSPCSYPSSGSSAAITSLTPTTTATPTGFNNGGLGGIGSSSSSFNTDGISSGVLLEAWRGSLLIALMMSGLIFMN